MDDITLKIEKQENRIYFYEDITDKTALALITTLEDMNETHRWNHMSKRLGNEYPLEPIWLHINSCGGDTFASLMVYDTIQALESPVYAVCEGITASGATIINAGCDKRYIRASTAFLVHQLSGAMWGTYEKMKDDMILNDMLMNRITDIYVKHSNRTRKQIVKMLKRDTWLDAKTAIKYGFVDEVLR